MKSALSNYYPTAFLRFLTGSPNVKALGGVYAFAQKQAPELANVIDSLKEALNVMCFEEAAGCKVLPEHWAYMASGVDDDGTLHANRESYKHTQLRPRMLRDAAKGYMRAELFGVAYNVRIFACLTGNRA